MLPRGPYQSTFKMSYMHIDCLSAFVVFFTQYPCHTCTGSSEGFALYQGGNSTRGGGCVSICLPEIFNININIQYVCQKLFNNKHFKCKFLFVAKMRKTENPRLTMGRMKGSLFFLPGVVWYSKAHPCGPTPTQVHCPDLYFLQSYVMCFPIPKGWHRFLLSLLEK